MNSSKLYWFKPEVSLVRLVRDINKPWDNENGGMICPAWFLKRWPKSCLFDLERPAKNGWIMVAFHNPALSQKELESMTYWVSPSVLVSLEP